MPCSSTRCGCSTNGTASRADRGRPASSHRPLRYPRHRAAPPTRRLHANLAKVRRIVGDLRSGLVPTTISLSLMNIISESVERAVLFLVRPDALSVVGAFGNNPGGQPLAQLTRGMRLPLAAANALTRALEDATVRSLSFDETGLPEAFTRHLGKPRSG